MATQATSASQRSLSDTTTPHGYATSRALDRVLSSCGLLNGVPLRFERADDVAKGGVLFALPALLNEGLLCHTREHYALPPGYYPLETIFFCWHCWRWCDVRRWSAPATKRRGNGVGCWRWSRDRTSIHRTPEVSGFQVRRKFDSIQP